MYKLCIYKHENHLGTSTFKVKYQGKEATWKILRLSGKKKSLIEIKSGYYVYLLKSELLPN